MRISDWSSDVCSSDLPGAEPLRGGAGARSRRQVRRRQDLHRATRGDGASFLRAGRPVPAGLYRAATAHPPRGGQDRKSVVSGKSVSESVDIGGRRIIKKKTNKKHNASARDKDKM